MQYLLWVMPEHAPLPGWLEVRGLRCPGRHGASPDEQTGQRLFLVDVVVRADVHAAAESDRLEDALDIAALVAAVREVVGGPPRVLLERVALDVARAILQRFPEAETVRVRLAKPDPPGLDAAEEAVELRLGRD